MRTLLLVLTLLVSAVCASAQTEWLKDASGGKIPDAAVVGRINGKPAKLNSGDIHKTGGLEMGSPDLAFDHYTISLRDGRNSIDSAFGVQVVLTVRRGELPYEKIFRRIFASELALQPGPKGNGVSALAEFYSLSFQSRPDPAPGQDKIMAGMDMSPSRQPFTGRVEIGKLKGRFVPVGLYVCMDDEPKSCVAGRVDIEVR